MTDRIAADPQTIVDTLLLWVDQPWPLDEQSARRIIRGAGWEPAPEGPNFFRTDFFPDNEAGYFLLDPSGELFTVSVSFGRLDPDFGNSETESVFRASFDGASELLDARYGAQPSETGKGVTFTTWYPPNGTSVVLGMSASHLSGHIDSPAWTTLDPDEDEDEEW